MFLVLVLDEKDNGIIQMVYAKNRKRLLNVAKSYLGSRGEDALHEAFIKLIEKYDGKIHELCDKEDYYFVTIVKNYSIDIIRKEKNIEVFDFEEIDSVLTASEDDPAVSFENIEAKDRILALVDRLKPDYREVLECKYILDMTNIEIAERLNVSQSVISTRISRARSELKALMEGEQWRD